MNEKIYIVRYYDYDHEDASIKAAFKSEVSTLAYIADKYAGRFDINDWGKRDFHERLFLPIDCEDYGAKLIIEQIEVLE